jgi:diguanylate cyclase (GGDEF)-like protein
MRASTPRGTQDIVLLEPGRCLYYALLTAAFAAVGLLCLRTTTAEAGSVVVEFSLNRLIYLYVFAATAAVFVTLGYVLRRQIDELRRLSTTDPLTGLQNRRGLQLKLRAECTRLEASAPLSLLLIDVDGLKAVNDERGHAAGDRVLKSVAAAIRMTVRATDFGSRWGGDEFAIVAPRTPRDAADRLAERLQHHLTRHSRAADLPISVSVGVVVAEADGLAQTNADDLMRAADGALYRAKNGGRNQVQVAPRWERPLTGHAGSVLQS